MRACAQDTLDIPACRARLLARRQAWAAAFSGQPAYDHTGRRPATGLIAPELDPEPGLARGRSPMWLARQYARVLDATPVMVEPWDPLPSAFCWSVADLLAPGGIVWPPEMQRARVQGGRLPAHAGVNIDGCTGSDHGKLLQQSEKVRVYGPRIGLTGVFRPPFPPAGLA